MSIDFLETQLPLTPDEAKQYSPLTLAFLGDSVYEVMVREMLLREANRPARPDRGSADRGRSGYSAPRQKCKRHQRAEARDTGGLPEGNRL